MSKVKIVTDSLANLTQEEIEQYNISVAHLNLLVDGQTFADNDIPKKDFFNKLKSATELPKTSQPSIGTFLNIYDSFQDDTTIISIHVAASLSGTGSAARQAGELSKNKVIVVDSTLADRGQAFQVIEAAKKAQAGASVDDILAHIEQVKQKTKLYICVFSLDNLIKGGRISRAKGLLSQLLNIKVIFEVKDGELIPYQKGRGAKTIQKFLDDTVYPDLTQLQVEECAVSYVVETEFIATQIERLKTYTNFKQLHIGYTIPSIAIHTGEGAFAIIYYEK